MRKKHYMFTNKKYSQRGMLSSVLGLIALAGVILSVVLSYREKGAMDPRFGLATFLAFLIAVNGLIQGIRAKLEKDVFLFFPIFGIVSDAFVLLWGVFIVYAGVIGFP